MGLRTAHEQTQNQMCCLRSIIFGSISRRRRKDIRKPIATGRRNRGHSLHSKYIVTVGRRFTTNERDTRKLIPRRKMCNEKSGDYSCIFLSVFDPGVDFVMFHNSFTLLHHTLVSSSLCNLYKTASRNVQEDFVSIARNTKTLQPKSATHQTRDFN